MKRLTWILVALFTGIVTCNAGMSKSRVRKESRFLTDKMAYELRLTTAQYDDVYEINYDFIYNVRNLMDEVIRGYSWALDEYYDYLDIRNDDLRWVLSARQYHEMMDLDYFYRPIYVENNRWTFRIYLRYTNFNHFYFPKPHHYKSYVGGHFRHHWGGQSYYANRHKEIHHHPAPAPIRKNEVTYRTSRKSDFGTITIRPNSDKREQKPATSRRSTTRHDDVYTIPSSDKKSTRREATDSRRTSTTTSKSNSADKAVRDSGSKNNTTRRTTSTSTTRSTDSTIRSSSNSSGSSRSTTTSTGSSRTSSSSSSRRSR
ncbi:MAG: hypothetical protein E7099_04300 [Mediterranea massiliensis]|nr:hypothetical protein [Mediterranea massiliensis]